MLNDIVKPEVHRRQRHPAGFDLAEIQDVVDDAQQVFSRTVHPLDVIALLLVQLGLEHQVAHAQDGVHGRADLVAHVGQKIALGPGRLLRQLLGQTHVLFGLFLCRDIDRPGQNTFTPGQVERHVGG